MNRKDKDRKVNQDDRTKKMHPVPVMALRWMTDEEWNRLAYQNFLERQVAKSGK